MRVVCIAGARPNFMKIAPVVAELDERGVENVLVHTGQHYDSAMSDVFFDELGIRAPDHHLEVGSGSHATQTAKVMTTFEPLLAELNPDWVVVVGDVNSTVACTLVAAKTPSKVAHVESGLRSRDWSMPEEVNRVATDHLSELLLAPSPDAIENLQAEGLGGRAVLVGNVMIDTLVRNLERARARSILEDLGLQRDRFALLTLHRPSNVDDPKVLAGLLGAVRAIAAHTPVVWPAHPRVAERVRSQDLGPNVYLIEPVGYLDSIALQDGSAFVMTDSGGLQEETSALGVLCLTLRTTTERPITIEQGTNTLVGVDPATIIAAAETARHRGRSAPAPIWDGRAAGRIVDALLTTGSLPGWDRSDH